jgi:hypothetical protein
MRFRFLASSFVMLAMIASMAHAGTMTTVLTLAGRFDATTFAPLPLVLLPNGRVANGQPGAYQIDVSFTSTNDAGDKGWANTLFDTGIIGSANGSNLGLDLNLGWLANANTLDTNGPAPGGTAPIYATNQDAGAPGALVRPWHPLARLIRLRIRPFRAGSVRFTWIGMALAKVASR